ncbi:hypothetical protein GJ744_005362 [Endocarpon pusillum]|uniref:Large ribosomal subunit protein mL46 N-terminal domain-containing protein n=1 Tax=Endocarpon pusillum TaxID=364733 RepID=A0A8H7AQD6_9EURO|nr:hypothetical protein GJ744_005362 [Endocarpon pusillum]
MNPSHQGAKRVASYLSASKTHICLSCRLAIAIPSQPPRYRSYATTATTPSLLLLLLLPPKQQQANELLAQPQPRPPPNPPTQIKAGIVLSRPPILTPDPHPFETAYHLYQRRLNERLVLPFTQYFYFKPDTPAYEAWRIARKARNGVAGRDVGGYNAFGKEGWNDEALMGDESGERAVIVRKLIDEEGRARKDRDVLGAQGKAADGGGNGYGWADRGGPRRMRRAM